MHNSPPQSSQPSLDQGKTQLVIMARCGRAGQTKTRLAGTVGGELAAAFHQVSLLTLLTRFAHAAKRCVLAVWPPEDLPLIEATASRLGWLTAEQVPGDLGRKMSQQFKTAFTSGYERVVMIGADSPHLPVPVIQRAFAALQASELVLGPSEDGGYYLIGGRVEIPDEIFVDIDWGTNTVFSQTCQRLRASDRAYTTLRPDFDVDVIQDVERLLHVLKSPTYGDAVWEPLRMVCQACVSMRRGFGELA